jgi:hypothetical protein
MSRQRLPPTPGARVWSTARVLTISALCALPAICLWAVAPSSALAGTATSKLSAELEQETGYSASQLEGKPACGETAPGQIACRAEILTVGRTGRAVSLRVRPHATPAPFTAERTRTSSQRAAAQPATAGVAAPALYTPAYLQWAYDLTYLADNDGSGDTIAIVDAYDDPNAAADLAQFRQEYGLYPCASTATATDCASAITTAGIFKQYNQSGNLIDQSGNGTAPPTDPTGGWEVEESLDVDAISSLCPYCTIDLVEATSAGNADFLTAVDEADALGPAQISMSWGVDDTPGGDYTVVNHNNVPNVWWFSGVSSLAAAGDYGYQGTSTVSYPAADNQITAIGGTSLAPADNARGFTESVWNDGYVSQAGSYEATQSGCDTSQSAPSYQSGVTTDCSGRAYNDISADADPNSGLAVYDSFGGNDNDVDGCDTTPANPGSCIVGGTSLATPLTAAYEALVGISPTDSPAWTYTDAASLFDVTQGNDITTEATCSLASICYAQTRWDGPTGNGTINGELRTGAPGVGGAYEIRSILNNDGTASADVAGGIYPNGLTTSYEWDYGTTTSYAQSPIPGSTSPLAGTAGLAPVSATITGLGPCTIYHFRLNADNVDADAYGYDTTFLTVSPSISGTATEGDSLTAELGLQPQTPCSVSYQWEKANSPTATFAPITGATSSTYEPTSADLGDYIELVVTATNVSGQATATSSAIGPITASNTGTTTTTTPTTTSPTPPPITPTTTTPTTSTTATSGTTTTTSEGSSKPQQPSVLNAPTITSSNQVGAKITVSGGSYEHATATVIQFFRCAHACNLLSAGGATAYRVRAADAGHYIEVKVTVYGAAGTTPLSSTNWIGPITDTSAGALTITSGAKVASVLRVSGSTGVALVTARLTHAKSQVMKVAISRATKSPTSTWLCVISRGAPVSCTAAHAVKRTVTLSDKLPRGQSLKLIAVRT